MDLRLVVRQLAILLGLLSASVVVVALGIAAAWPGPAEVPALWALGATAVVGLAVAGALWLLGRGAPREVGRREALLLVGASWLIGAGLAALPFWLWAQWSGSLGHPFAGYAHCYFEAMSGLTTTGATVLGDVDGLPRALLLWRALTHWLGGLGIVVLFVAVLPGLGVGGKKLFQIESTGPAAQGVRPRIRETARVLWTIYCGMTVLLVLLLLALGVSVFEAVCYTFATVSTGGFGTHGASVGHFDSVAVQGVVAAFMVLGGVNFGLYYLLFRGQYRAVRRDPELRLYLGLLALGTLVATASLYGGAITTTAGRAIEAAGVWEALRYGAFQIFAIHTTTGFATADFDAWPAPGKAAVVLALFVGGSAGSTSGGIKVLRVLIAGKVILAEIERVFRPYVVLPVRLGGTTIEPELRTGTLVYLLLTIGLFALGTAAILLIEPGPTFLTAASASASTLNNIGPGFGAVGPVENYGGFSAGSQLVMSLLMALGRLEIYAVFVLFLPGFWRSE